MQRLISPFKGFRGILILTVVILFGSFCCYAAVTQGQTQAKWADFNAVCDGTAVTAAATYTNQAGLHPIVYFEGTAESWQPDAFGYFSTPDKWLPEDALKAELVACMQETVKTIEECDYGAPKKVIRTKSIISVELRASNTGELIAAETFNGANPKECAATEKFKKSQSTKTFAGNRPEEKTVQAWLAQYVEQ